MEVDMSQAPSPPWSAPPGAVRILLSGDVMAGRGIDQVLPHPGDPRLEEDYVRRASDYVRLAEAASGPIRPPLDFAEIWGEARRVWRRMAPDVRIMNLETAVTTSDAFAPKAVNYRMHPANTPCLASASPDVLTLANNHVMDFGAAGLIETLEALWACGLATAGAGRDLAEASAPATIATRRARILVFALGTSDSGVPASWSATSGGPGVAHTGLAEADAQRLAARIRAERRPGDLAVVSIHWGSNWGYEAPGAHRRFAHGLIDSGEVALVHGHSSHHPRPIEVYRDRLILYGCGDLLNDYEGIRGYEAYRGELALLYFADLEAASGALARLQLAPLRVRRLRLAKATAEETGWLAATLSRESRPLGVTVAQESGSDLLEVAWERSS
jgi:poly-gamma-glutamate synthesis protein (capsule biosynthesis protein)